MSTSLDSRLVWLIWASTSINTSKYLLDRSVDYPLHLLFAHITLIHLYQLTQWLFNGKGSKQDLLQSSLRSPGLKDVLSSVLIIITGLMLIFAYKSLMISSNLPSLMMILTLDWQPTRLLLGILERKLVLFDAARYFMFAGGVCLVLLCDFRMRPTSLHMSLSFLGLTGLTEVISILELKPHKPYLRLTGDHQPCWPTGWEPYVLIPIGVYAVKTEFTRPDTWIPLLPDAIVLLVNFLATTTAFISSPFRSGHCPPDYVSLDEPSGKAPASRSLTMLALTGAVCAQNLLLHAKPAVLSIWQYVGYLVALFAFTTVDEFRTIFMRKAYPSDQNLDVRTVGKPLSPIQMSGLSVLSIITWSWILYSSLTLQPPLPDVSSLKLDLKFHSDADFDIVVARYNEPMSDLAKDIHSLLEAANLRELGTRVFVYNKGNESTVLRDTLAAELPGKTSLTVIPLENIGREGDTFLHHITTSWDNIAAHTLFMQARIENLSQVKSHIEAFLVPQTGFLSLSYEGSVCKQCEHCHDVYWFEDPGLTTNMYSLANAGNRCQNLVLTYRGQFIVSAPRIRGNDRTMYDGVMQQLRDPDSHIHSPIYTESIWHKHQNDSLNNPVFGYTLERMWGALFQCSNLRVGYWAPSLLSTFVRPTWLLGNVPLDAAQCLDRPI